jgi:hypothetical protein
MIGASSEAISVPWRLIAVPFDSYWLHGCHALHLLSYHLPVIGIITCEANCRSIVPTLLEAYGFLVPIEAVKLRSSVIVDQPLTKYVSEIQLSKCSMGLDSLNSPFYQLWIVENQPLFGNSSCY